jgi:uncharacterized membrane protein
MPTEKQHVQLKVAGLSALAGMRSMSGPALLSLDQTLVPNGSVAASFLRSPYVKVGVTTLALAEMFADKLPFLPKRTAFPSLCFRALSGAVIGASIYSVEDLPPAEGALIGGVSAVAATYISYHIRRTLTKTFQVPDFLVALAEDSLIAACGINTLKSQLEKNDDIHNVNNNGDGTRGQGNGHSNDDIIIDLQQ